MLHGRVFWYNTFFHIYKNIYYVRLACSVVFLPFSPVLIIDWLLS